MTLNKPNPLPQPQSNNQPGNNPPGPPILRPPGGPHNQAPRNLNPNQPLVNEAIRTPQVRLISSSGEQLGIVATRDAMDKARSEDLDLVVIGMQQSPPVAKIMDFGKYKFEKEKEEKERKKKSKAQSVFKEIKMSARIDDHDIQVKLKWVLKWLEEGNKVRVVVQMRGREMQHPEIPRKLLQGILEATAEVGKPDQMPPIKQEGKMFSLQLAPSGIVKK
ncbi:MAG: translation initiation factor IF-3 [Candidatus Caenarcaniphilales bacterium]|nr:translation initiation factor IF-3 [Candidatus Caenarcaniphilales bacterium]